MLTGKLTDGFLKTALNPFQPTFIFSSAGMEIHAGSLPAVSSVLFETFNLQTCPLNSPSGCLVGGGAGGGPHV